MGRCGTKDNDNDQTNKKKDDDEEENSAVIIHHITSRVHAIGTEESEAGIAPLHQDDPDHVTEDTLKREQDETKPFQRRRNG